MEFSKHNKLKPLCLHIALISLGTALPVPSVFGGAPTERKVEFSYHAEGTNGAGLIATIDGPRTDLADNDVTSFGYDEKGNLASITNPLGHLVLRANFTGRGDAQTLVDSNGVTRTMTYSPRGWLTSLTVVSPAGNSSLDATTTYDYDGVGQVTRITSPDGSYLDYTYDDARRLQRVTNNLGEYVEYALDAMGNRTAETIYDSSTSIVRTQSRVFDELSRLTNVIQSDGDETLYGYDQNDNLNAITNGRLNLNTQAFDALNRLKTQTNPDGNEVSYTYDVLDQLTSVTDHRGLTTSYDVDVFGNVNEINSPDTGITTFDYDAAGNRIRKLDARGIETLYTYDALNRLTSVSYPSSPLENITYGYDDTSNGNFGIGRLTSITDETGATVYRYDHRGNVIQKSVAIGSQALVTAYSYDLADNLQSITYPSGRIVSYTRDAAGRVNGISSQTSVSSSSQTIISDVAYLPFGPISSITYGNGVVQNFNHNQDYELTDLEAAGTSGLLDLDYQYDANGNIEAITDTLNNSDSQHFTYDALDRLDNATGVYGDKDYTYDEVGNRTQLSSVSNTGSSTEDSTYESSSNRLSQVDIDNGTLSSRQLAYDAVGNIIQDARPDGSIRNLTYSSANRLQSVTEDGEFVVAYVYNALGQRAMKDLADTSESRLFQFDEQGMLLAEYKTDGTALNEYVYLGDQRIAMFSAPIPEVNQEPNLLNDSAITLVDQEVLINVLANDSDPEGDALSLVSANAANGLVAINADGSISYLPNEDFVGQDTIAYEVSDGQGNTAQSFVSVSVELEGIVREWWSGIYGSSVSNLTTSGAYQNPPTGRAVLSEFSAPSNVGNIYGARIRGSLIAPESGLYTFWISADDNAELWLSTNGNSTNKALIASVPGWTNPNVWNKYPEQQSGQIQLEAGQAYYIEALHKEGWSNDHVSIAWQLPSQSSPVVIGAGDVISSSVSSSNINQAPIANADLASTPEDTSVDIDVLSNDTDADSDTLTVVSATAISGTVVVTPENTLSYTPASDFIGTDTLSYTISDGQASHFVQGSVEVSVTLEGLVREWWTSINGSAVSSLTSNSAYPGLPDGRSLLVSFESPSNVGSIYGARIRGTLIAPETGLYTLLISGDDNAELWLSTDENESAKSLVAQVPGWTHPKEWSKYPEQQSIQIQLQAGERYYIEALHKEGWSNDHLAIAWQTPSDSSTQIIPSSVFESIASSATLNSAPSLVSDSANTGVNQAVNVDVLANDSDADGDSLEITSVSANFGSVSIESDETVTYTPLPDFVGQDTVTYTVSDGQGGHEASETLSISVVLNGLVRESWAGLSGSAVSTLTNHPTFPAVPDSTSTLTDFVAPSNQGDTYGARIRGTLVAPITGEYRFWISGDDNAELWLSTDSTSINKEMVAEVPGWTNPQVWDKYPEQQSLLITLQAGEHYYIEALHKEGWGGDHIAVAWEPPGSSSPEVITGSHILTQGAAQ